MRFASWMHRRESVELPPDVDGFHISELDYSATELTPICLVRLDAALKYNLKQYGCKIVCFGAGRFVYFNFFVNDAFLKDSRLSVSDFRHLLHPATFHCTSQPLFNQKCPQVRF